MKALQLIRTLIGLTLMVIRNEPIKIWRKLENGKYICDGDCGRWSMHGVCTCGLCHEMKYQSGGHDKIERDRVSWRREADTQMYMQSIPVTTKCHHDNHLNEGCDTCRKEMEAMMVEFKEYFGK